MPSQNRLTLTLIAVLALDACTLGPNFKTPAPPQAASYTMSGDAVPAEARLAPDNRTAGAWWRAFGSPQLNEVMALALAGNQNVAVANANLERLNDLVRAERGQQAPQVTANAGVQRERINIAAFGFTGFPGFPPIPNPTISLYSIGGQVSYDLDLFGGERRRVEEARAQRDAQGFRADAAYLTLTSDVAMAAAQIAGIRARQAALQAIIADDRRTLDIVHAGEAAGGEAPSAARGGQAQLAADLALVPPLDQQLARERHALATLVGRPSGAWTAPDFDLASFTPPPTIDLAVPSELVRRRPDIRAAEADLHAATADVGVATANLYPDLKLVAGLTQEALTPSSLFTWNSTAYNFGAGLTAPIFEGGTLRARRRATQAQVKVALAQYRQTILTAFNQVADALTAVAHDDERIVALTRGQTVALASLEDTRNALRLGGGNLANVVVAQRQANRARMDLADAQAQRLADLVTLSAAVAGDWRS